MFGVRKAPTGCNFVHNDEIWKDHVHRELQTLRRWPDTWGFLAAHYQVKGKSNKQPTNRMQSCYQTYQSSTTRSSTPSGSGDSTIRLPPISRQSEHLDLTVRRLAQPCKSNASNGTTGRKSGRCTQAMGGAGVSPPRYPQTTAREVGWRSGDIGSLEKYGRHARGQTGIRKLLNWPREAIL